MQFGESYKWISKLDSLELQMNIEIGLIQIQKWWFLFLTILCLYFVSIHLHNVESWGWRVLFIICNVATFLCVCGFCCNFPNYRWCHGKIKHTHTHRHTGNVQFKFGVNESTIICTSPRVEINVYSVRRILEFPKVKCKTKTTRSTLSRYTKKKIDTNKNSWWRICCFRSFLSKWFFVRLSCSIFCTSRLKSCQVIIHHLFNKHYCYGCAGIWYLINKPKP